MVGIRKLAVGKLAVGTGAVWGGVEGVRGEHRGLDSPTTAAPRTGGRSSPWGHEIGAAVRGWG